MSVSVRVWTGSVSARAKSTLTEAVLMWDVKPLQPWTNFATEVSCSLVACEEMVQVSRRRRRKEVLPGEAEADVE